MRFRLEQRPISDVITLRGSGGSKPVYFKVGDPDKSYGKLSKIED
jgi:hypothetical protein